MKTYSSLANHPASYTLNLDLGMYKVLRFDLIFHLLKQTENTKINIHLCVLYSYTLYLIWSRIDNRNLMIH